MSEVVRDRLVTAEDGVRHEGAPGGASKPAPTPPAAHRHLGELYRKVDATFARARARHGARMGCVAGCNDCCRQQLSVTAVEASVIREALAGLPPEVQRAIARRAADPAACPALDEGGACAIYAARPLPCRTQGMPIRLGPQPGVRALPVVEACPKNFAGQDLTALDAASVLDQRTLTNVLGSLDAAYADETGGTRGERIGLAALLAGEAAAGAPR